jgi:LCP family protein required for cell wall assembly
MPGQPPSGPAPRTRSTAQKGLIGVGAVLSVMCLVGALLLAQGVLKLDQIARLGGTELDEAGDDEPKNYLVVGSDSREVIDEDDPSSDAFTGGSEDTSGKRADTIMVVRVDPQAERLDVVSFPRDLWIEIAGTGGRQRINTAYTAGPQQLIDTLRQDFDIEINHYAEIDFKGFQGIVEAVDGVPMWFDAPMRDANSGLNVTESGCVTLDGEQALAFARARHLQYYEDGRWKDDPTADLGRISRQQIFMRRMFDRAASEVSLTDPIAMNQLLDVAVADVTIDENLEVTKAINLAQRFGTFEGDSIHFYSLPVEGFMTDGGAAVVRLIEPDADRILNIFRGLPEDYIDPSSVSLTVRNGSGTPMQATDLSEALDAIGFETEIGADTSSTESRTVVRHAPGSEANARLVARHLEQGAELEEDSSLDDGSIVLITGTDFTKALRNALPEDASEVTVAAAGSSAPTTGGSSSSSGAGSSAATTAPSTTSTTVVGRTPGSPPDGVECG